MRSVQRGHTYATDGSIYFKIATLPSYGKLARLDHDGIQSGARDRLRRVRQGKRARLRAVEGDQAGRADLGRAASARAAPAGTSSARRWRCGCWANRRSTFTPAASTWSSRITRTRSRRSEGATGKEFLRFWFHVEHLLVDNEKMSKSLGNFYHGPGRARHLLVVDKQVLEVDPVTQNCLPVAPSLCAISFS